MKTVGEASVVGTSSGGERDFAETSTNNVVYNRY
jgi:hypothetical protein